MFILFIVLYIDTEVR